jgi:hypothetical protein
MFSGVGGKEKCAVVVRHGAPKFSLCVVDDPMLLVDPKEVFPICATGIFMGAVVHPRAEKATSV